MHLPTTKTEKSLTVKTFFLKKNSFITHSHYLYSVLSHLLIAFLTLFVMVYCTYMHICLCIYIYCWLDSAYERDHAALFFLNMYSKPIHFLQIVTTFFHS